MSAHRFQSNTYLIRVSILIQHRIVDVLVTYAFRTQTAITSISGSMLHANTDSALSAIKNQKTRRADDVNYRILHPQWGNPGARARYSADISLEEVSAIMSQRRPEDQRRRALSLNYMSEYAARHHSANSAQGFC